MEKRYVDLAVIERLTNDGWEISVSMETDVEHVRDAKYARREFKLYAKKRLPKEASAKEKEKFYFPISVKAPTLFEVFEIFFEKVKRLESVHISYEEVKMFHVKHHNKHEENGSYILDTEYKSNK